MDNSTSPVKHEGSELPDPALLLRLQKLREMHRPEEEIVCLDM